jgi:hypothetical protein
VHRLRFVWYRGLEPATSAEGRRLAIPNMRIDPANSSSRPPAIPRGAGSAYGGSMIPSTGGRHAVQDERNLVAWRDGTARPRGSTNDARPVGNYPNSGRCNQTVDCDGRAAPFQSRQCQPAARREEQRVSGRRRPLPDVRIDRGVARWRDQNAQRRRGAIYRQRKDSGTNSGHRGAVDFPPLLSVSRSISEWRRSSSTTQRLPSNEVRS